MNILITEAAYRDIWSTTERLATLSAAISLAFIDGLNETLHLMARRLEEDVRRTADAADAIQYVAYGKYLVFYTASETDLEVLHISDSAAEIELMFGDRGSGFLGKRRAARSARAASAAPARRPMTRPKV